jgi:hypothetical protein
VTAARQFDAFPLYWVGEQFETLRLAHIDGLDRTSEQITFIYGTCTPAGSDEPSCVPPLELQVSRLCSHLDIVAKAPIWKRRHIRGAPVGAIDSARVLFSRGAQIKVYRGAGTDPGLPLRALRALRSINQLPPVISAADPIPAPARSILDRTRPCT